MKQSLTLPLLVSLVSSAALADDGAVLKCRALPEAASRLACYDAMPVAPALVPERAVAATADFGSESIRKKPEALPAAMESTVAGEFDGWGPNARIKLANGQVWRVIDDSSAVLPRRSNTRVRIERNLFGTLFLTVEGTNQSAKVRRVD